MSKIGDDSFYEECISQISENTIKDISVYEICNENMDNISNISKANKNEIVKLSNFDSRKFSFKNFNDINTNKNIIKPINLNNSNNSKPFENNINGLTKNGNKIFFEDFKEIKTGNVIN